MISSAADVTWYWIPSKHIVWTYMTDLADRACAQITLCISFFCEKEVTGSVSADIPACSISFRNVVLKWEFTLVQWRFSRKSSSFSVNSLIILGHYIYHSLHCSYCLCLCTITYNKTWRGCDHWIYTDNHSHAHSWFDVSVGGNRSTEKKPTHAQRASTNKASVPHGHGQVQTLLLLCFCFFVYETCVDCPCNPRDTIY